jgi:heptosyltransferase-2
MHKIGVWNTAFLGDAVLTLPLLVSLKAAFPRAELHYWVRAGLEGLFAAQPELDGVHGFAKRGGQKGLLAARALGRDIARQGYGLWLSAHASPRSGFIARWTGVPVRIGYDLPLYNRWLYTHTVSRRFRELDEVERLLQLLLPLGVAPSTHWPELALDPAAQARAAAWREAHPGPLLGIHPGSVWPTKRWPAERFAAVGRRALDAGARVALFAGPGEEAVAAEVRSAMGDRPGVLDLSGALSLPELAAHLDRLDCYLTNDSGPMHLAWARRTPVVALFGPTVRGLGFFPRGEASTVLEAPLECRPCGLHGHRECPKGHHRCMADIGADAAWAAVAPHLDGEAA